MNAPKPYNFATDSNLPPAIGRLMQAAADKRAAAGLISADGQTHTTTACRDLYDAGYGVLSRAYMNAMGSK